MSPTDTTAIPQEKSCEGWGAWLEEKATSILLVVATLTFGCISIVLLSATLTQTRLSSIGVGGVNISIPKLAYAARLWAAQQREKELAAAKLGHSEKERVGVSNRATFAEEAWRQQWAPTSALLETLSLRIKGKYPDIIASEGDDLALGTIARILAMRDELSSQYPNTSRFLDEIAAARGTVMELKHKQLAARIESRWFLSTINGFNEDIRMADGRITKVFDAIQDKMDAATKIKLENAFHELDSKNGIGTAWASLVTLPPDTLALWLVLFMGILGSALQVTHAFFKSGVTGNWGSYFLRLSVGALAAIIIFIVAKAGVPIIADSSKFGGDAPINPYFVSFLAIISGLLSENAIANIQAQGTRVLGQAADAKMRWARRDLTADLKAAGFTAERLRPLLDAADTDKTVLMINGTETMSATQQRVIELILRTDARDLFTDFPPPQTKLETKPPETPSSAETKPPQ